MPTDIEIARSVTPLPITEVAKNAGVDVKHLIPYGFDKAKVDYSLLNEPTDHRAKLVLVTAINPTPAGEGKTTTTIGLADGLRRRGVKSAVALREPSLGPVFGVKGGAAGGGYAQVVPMEDINLHFTGDFHAIGAANNLLAAMLDNHIQQGNALGIDVKRITWKRCVDMNDRQLRNVIDGLGGRSFGDGVFRVFERSDLERWHRVVSGCFTKLRGEFNLIGYDWMGRCFAVDQRDGDGKELVVLLEIATLDMYYIGKDVAVFLNEVMPNQSEACLGVGRYREWLEGHAPVGRMECGGYRIPLFLGGEDSLENMEVSDMEVYWDMTDQLWEAVKDLPEGTKIGNISFE